MSIGSFLRDAWEKDLVIDGLSMRFADERDSVANFRERFNKVVDLDGWFTIGYDEKPAPVEP
jgi:hypothetical protein